MDKQGYIFKIKYRCLNCNNEFKRKYIENIRVVASSNNSAIEDKIDQSLTDALKEQHVKYARCPHCNDNRLKILKRTPLNVKD